MEHNKEGLAPASPSAQYFNSSALSISIIAVLESEVPINDEHAMSLLKDVFLPINPRFSSIMVLSLSLSLFWCNLLCFPVYTYFKEENTYYICGFSHLQNCNFFFLFYEIYTNKKKCMELRLKGCQKHDSQLLPLLFIYFFLSFFFNTLIPLQVAVSCVNLRTGWEWKRWETMEKGWNKAWRPHWHPHFPYWLVTNIIR